ncbi:MAG: hypothetical protein HeimC3_26130 [Candidatus Heimdallarchaeota archaeon LC_3]|nr:MAG: hypothetical protein HeimC3_26130 [Candidatus Heimdallarchaeota archaeon LC_3]
MSNELIKVGFTTEYNGFHFINVDENYFTLREFENRINKIKLDPGVTDSEKFEFPITAYDSFMLSESDIDFLKKKLAYFKALCPCKELICVSTAVDNRNIDMWYDMGCDKHKIVHYRKSAPKYKKYDFNADNDIDVILDIDFDEDNL